MPRDLRSPVWVCSFHEVGLSRENWIVQGQRKSVEKRPHVARKLCATQGLIFTFERLSEDAPFCPKQDADDSQ
jgi:hypothetical protein